VSDPSQASAKSDPQGQVGQMVQLITDYAKQETIGPLRSAGRWILFGVVGALLIGFGTAMMALGLLRMVQHEWPGTFHGRWMALLPYLFGLVFCLFIVVLAVSRINKDPLHKENG
jgi:hypothetical protein